MPSLVVAPSVKHVQSTAQLIFAPMSHRIFAGFLHLRRPSPAPRARVLRLSNLVVAPYFRHSLPSTPHLSPLLHSISCPSPFFMQVRLEGFILGFDEVPTRAALFGLWLTPALTRLQFMNVTLDQAQEIDTRTKEVRIRISCSLAPFISACSAAADAPSGQASRPHSFARRQHCPHPNHCCRRRLLKIK